MPEAVLTNQHLEKMVDTTDAWIVERSSVPASGASRHGGSRVGVGVAAARQALAASGIEPERISYIVLRRPTLRPLYPAGAIRIQEELGLSKAVGFDLQAGCSGFNYALYVAERLVKPEGQYALVIGSDVCTRFTDWTDRATCLLFGDGAGAVVIGPSHSNRILSFVYRLQPQYEALLQNGVQRGSEPISPPAETQRQALPADGRAGDL